MDIPVRPKRQFLPEQLEINSWEVLRPYFEDLTGRSLATSDDFERWLADLSELEAVLEEDGAWRYIRMTIDTRNEEHAAAYRLFVTEIQPNAAPFVDTINRKLAESPFAASYASKGFGIYLRKVQTEIELFREENVALQSELQQLAQEYSQISGSLKVEIDGEELTMQQAAARLQRTDRDYRKRVFELIQEGRLGVKDQLDSLFDQLVLKRQELAENAGFANFRDYKFRELGRFDYTPQDCFDFHQSIEQTLCPIAEEIALERKSRMGVDRLRPWDLSVDPEGRPALNPFKDGQMLTEKSIAAFDRVDAYFGDCLRTMNTMGYLDLESKPGKAPGGYNYPLYEIGVPFIFMNAVGTQRDMVTMMHEGGHAVHSFLTRDLKLTSYKSCPSEVAELASMSMELLSMDHWNVFYSDEEELRRAKKDHLEDILSMLPWIASIDLFQHRLYENPTHTASERKAIWKGITSRFGSGVVDWSGYEAGKEYSWQRQLHLFEVPFYYIEYGMAQLGALAVWRNYKSDPKQAISQYKRALELGYTESIPEIYAAAGIRFDFSLSYISELADFVQQELKSLS